MHRLMIPKRETVTQINDNLIAQFNKRMGYKRIRTLQIFEFKNTRSHVKNVLQSLKT